MKINIYSLLCKLVLPTHQLTHIIMIYIKQSHNYWYRKNILQIPALYMKEIQTQFIEMREFKIMQEVCVIQEPKYMESYKHSNS